MKKIAFILTAALLLSDMALAEKTITAFAAPTIYSRIEGKKTVGPVITIAEKIFDKYGLKLKIRQVPWARAIDELRAGKLDMILTIFATEEREKFATFTVPYGYLNTSAFVPKGRVFPLNSWNDLVGKKGLMIRGRSEGQKFDQFAKANLTLAEKKNIYTILKMIAHGGRGDYGIEKETTIRIESIKLGVDKKIVILPTPLVSNPIRFGISKKSQFNNLVPKVNKEIEAYVADGTIKNLVDREIELATKSK